MRIGTKRFSLWIGLYKGKTNWHTGKYTLIIAKGHYVDGVGWGWSKHGFIPIGRRYTVPPTLGKTRQGSGFNPGGIGSSLPSLPGNGSRNSPRTERLAPADDHIGHRLLA